MLTQTSSQVSYDGDGSTTDFAIPYYFVRDAHIVAKLYTIVGLVLDATWVLGTDYTLTGSGVEAGGTLTATIAPASGKRLVIQRVVPLTQLTDYLPHAQFPAPTLERDLDLLMMAIQQVEQQYLNALAGLTPITGIDLTAAYDWTGRHSFARQSVRGVPGWVMKSLQSGVDVGDGNITLASDYSAAMDLRKTTTVSVEAPADASWGGVFNVYGQHVASGTCGANGTLTGVIRAQMETSQAIGAATINDAVAIYAGIYNNGTDCGAFGVHVDAYHVGAEAAAHSTYGVSVEGHKTVSDGRMALFVGRALNGDPDYGLLLENGASGNQGRGIQLGAPTYANGGIQGSTGSLSTFQVGIDLSWAACPLGAIQIRRDNEMIWSGVNQAQTTAPDRTCTTAWNSSNGSWAIMNAGTFRFQVNMTDGLIRQNGNDAISLHDSAKAWLFSYTSTGSKDQTTVGAAGGASALPATPTRYIKIVRDGTTLVIPAYAVS